MKTKTARLSEREKEVLILICQQATNEEIAEKIFLSPFTVKTHRQILMKKTGSRNVVGLVIYAIKNHLFSPEDSGTFSVQVG